MILPEVAQIVSDTNHGPDHDCSDCSANFRQGRTLASVESSAWGFGLAALGIFAMLVAALVMA